MQGNHISIKKVTIEDAPALLSLSKETFFEFFGPLNDPANMEAYSAIAFTPKKIIDELNDTNSKFYFALFDNKLIGYLKLNFDAAQTEFKATDAMEVERIYVSCEHHGKYFGKQLLLFAVESAKARKLTYLWLGVWENNHKAIAFYTRNGFSVFGKHEFLLGTDRQSDLLMKRML